MIKQDPHWFQKKWGTDHSPIDILSNKVLVLEEKYNALLLDVKRLEEENIETSNLLYEIMNSLDSIQFQLDNHVQHTS